MIRALLSATALLAAGACSYGSAVDTAPKNDRIPKRAVVSGDYCAVEGSHPPFTVAPSDEEACIRVTWNQTSRTYTLADPADPDSGGDVAVVALGAGLYLAQAEVDPDDPRKGRDRYQIFLGVSEGNAFALLPPLGDDALRLMLEAYPAIRTAKDGAGRTYIAEGNRSEIKAFLRNAAAAGLQLARKAGTGIDIAVLDTAGAADHPATPQQTKDIETVLKRMAALTDR